MPVQCLSLSQSLPRRSLQAGGHRFDPGWLHSLPHSVTHSITNGETARLVAALGCRGDTRRVPEVSRRRRSVCERNPCSRATRSRRCTLTHDCELERGGCESAPADRPGRFGSDSADVAAIPEGPVHIRVEPRTVPGRGRVVARPGPVALGPVARAEDRVQEAARASARVVGAVRLRVGEQPSQSRCCPTARSSSRSRRQQPCCRCLNRCCTHRGSARRC